MTNLLWRAKPELISAISVEKEKYPRLMEELIKELESEIFVRNLRYHAILALESLIKEYKIPMEYGVCAFDLFFDVDALK